jgi:CBS domain-containing protein
MLKTIERLGTLKARDVMTTDVVVLAPQTPLQDAVRTFAEANISGAPVVDANGRLIGVLSAHDVARPENVRDGALSLDGDDDFRGGASERDDEVEDPEDEILAMNDYRSTDLRSGLVTDFMTPGVITVDPTTSLKQICERMVSEHIHRVLVVDRQELLGIVSSLDIVRAVAQYV